MLSPLTPLGSRVAKSVAVLHTCEQIHKLFEDRIYIFSENKLVSSPYLASFSSVYLVVANLVYKLRQELRETLVQDIDELAELNKVYTREAIRQRKGQLSCEYSMLKFYYEDTLPGGKLHIPQGHYKDWYTSYAWREQCEMCLEISRRSIDTQFGQLFPPIIAKANTFFTS